MVQCVSEPHITDEIYPRNEVESLSDQTGSPRDLGRENGWLLGQLDNDSCPGSCRTMFQNFMADTCTSSCGV